MVVNHNNLVALPVILIKKINPCFFLLCFFCPFSQDGVMSRKMVARASLVDKVLHVGRTTPTEGENQLTKTVSDRNIFALLNTLATQVY